MPAPDCPLLTVDVVVFNPYGQLLLIKRRDEPFRDQWALPGGFVDKTDRNVTEAALRELREEARLVLGAPDLRLVGVYSELGRDPRGPVTSVAFLARIHNVPPVGAGDDAKEVIWMSQWKRMQFAFDHNKIVDDAFKMPRKVRV